MSKDFELAVQYHRAGLLDKAARLCHKVLIKKPKHAQAFHLLGFMAHQKNDLIAAIEWHQKAVEAKPDFAQAYNSLGAAYLANRDFDEALEAFCKGSEIMPSHVQMLANYAAVLKECGKIKESIAIHLKVLSASPIWHEARSSLLLLRQYLPTLESQFIHSEHRKWADIHAAVHYPKSDSQVCDRRDDRRLRIGMVSPDFKDHPVTRFLFPYLKNHDRGKFEIFAYAHVGQPDEWTKRIRDQVEEWRDIVGMPDAEMADLVRKDQIDILVDLAGHTLGNRLLVFARKPAPIQVTYLGYPTTTGIETIDYRISDSLADPAGMTEAYHTEKLIRLSQSAWCYEPDREVPRTQSPALKKGYVTFGSFNNIAKINEPMLRLWARILETIPSSRLLLKAGGFSSLDARKRVEAMMITQAAIDFDRIEIRGPEETHEAHLKSYQDVDIALDTFPYHGTTTTCEALWMGVPVVTLAGQSHVSRVGVSLLTNIGLPELVAESEDEYVRIAVELARDVEQLVNYRSNLRDKMLGSQLLDAPSFAREIEGAFRQMWTSWCETPLDSSKAANP
jgi:predicted O-linked N-acetylglucosamine transferase (SPINDLY family)